VIGTETADASFTDQAGIVCVVLTADCLPVLVCSQDGQKIAAIHAGWRGLLAGIISNTIAAMQTSDVLVWLGPAIGPDCFEVGTEVREGFVEKSCAFASAFSAAKEGKWLADIYQLARIELANIGITRIYGGGFCTVTESNRFFSYRRDHVTGRMATLIWRT
jgi:YfiH family protein